MTVAQIYARTAEDSKDILQDAFIIIFRKTENFVGDEESAYLAWMKSIVRNTAISRYQRMKFSNELYGVDYVDPYSDPEAYTQLGEKEIMKMVLSLPDGYRQVFALYAIEGFSHKEIADQLDIKEGTSRSQYVRARKMLQHRIAEYSKIATS